MFRDPILSAFDRLRRLREGDPLVVSPSRRATVGDVDRLARGLEGRLVAEPALDAGTPVVFSVRDGASFLASFLACRRRGLIPVLLDWRAPSPERSRVLEELGCGWILSCDTLWPEGPDDWRILSTEMPPERETAQSLPPDVAAIKLSSGSTGSPRGIVTPAEALAADDAALARTMGLASNDRILASVPMSHSYGLASVALPALVRGSMVVLADEGSGPFGTLQAARLLNATFLPTVPAFLGALVRAERPPRLAESLRLIVSAGAPLPPETAVRFRRIYRRPVQVFYGSSETGGICFDREGGAGERGSVGTAVEGVRVRLEPVEAPGGAAPVERETGIVEVESPAVAERYWPDPHAGLCGGRFRTSDLARWRDGELVLLGRTDDLINVRGKKVNPREVEETLEGLPGVREVVAFGDECADRGETTLRVVVAAAGEVTQPEVVAWCRGRLAEHKVPRSVMLVDEIPRTPRGKFDRRAIARLTRDRGGERDRRIATR